MSHYFERVRAQTGGRFWVNNPTLREMDLALAHGAMGCTTNPGYGGNLVKRAPDEVLPIVRACLPESADDEVVAELVQARLVGRICERFAPLHESSGGREGFVARLKERAVFPSVAVLEEGAELPAGALLVEGDFTKLNPGSRGKRYWVGMGAGKSKICIAGRVVSAAGDVLATFEHCRSGTMGWFGGRAEGMMATDVHQTAFHLADFMAAWATASPPIPTRVSIKYG